MTKSKFFNFIFFTTLTCLVSSVWADGYKIRTVHKGVSFNHHILYKHEKLIVAGSGKSVARIINLQNIEKTKDKLNYNEYSSNYFRGFEGSNNDVIVVDGMSNKFSVLDRKSLRHRSTFTIEGFEAGSDEEGNYSISDGCVMNDALYFTSFTDRVILRIKKKEKTPKVIATFESVGLSDNSQIICLKDKLIVNNKGVSGPADNAMLVLSLDGALINKVNIPGLKVLRAYKNKLLAIVAPFQPEFEYSFMTPSPEAYINVLDSMSGDVLGISVNTNNPQDLVVTENGQVFVSEKGKATFIIDGKSVVSPNSSNGFSVYSAEDLSPLKRVQFNEEDGIELPRGIAVTPDGKRVYIESVGKVSEISKF